MNNELINTNETVTNNSIPTTNIAAATTPPIITTINNNNNENINSNINKRNVSVIHQILVISNIDFENENIYGFTELSLAPNINNNNNVITSTAPTTNELTFDTICLNLKQCKILYLCFNGSIETEYEYCDPSLVKPCNDETKRDLQSLLYQDELGRLAVDADESNGELLIQVPESIREQLKNGINIKLAIEFILEKPTGGIRFVLDDGSDQQQPTVNPCLYTIENSSYCWFPCLNSYNEYCTWKIEVIVDEDLTVISSGSLIETELINFKTIDNCSMDLSTNVSQTNIETNKKKFHFYVTQPTCAPNIGLVVGRFECQQDENISELIYYSDPVLMDLVKNSCAFLQDAFEFYEDILGKHYPHTSPFKLIFVYDTHEDCFHYSNMAILNVCLLHSKQIIEQTFLTRRLIANALARQYFGCFITMFNWHSWWLLTGLAAHLTGLYLKKILGNNEYKYMIYQDMKEVCSYEREHGYILLDLNFNELNSKETANKCNILLKNPLIASLNYLKVAEKKSHLVIRLIDECLGREIMIQLLNKILNEAINCSTVAAQKTYSFNCWSNLALSTESFTDALATFSSKDIKHLLDHWVYRSGCARLNVIFNFNRKKNTLELELKQDMANQKGYKKYIGPITFIIQELDGSFSHHLQVDDQVPCKFDIALHSKGKKSKKKKIPLITGEEVDIDTSQMDSDSPILWIRIDPDMKIIREIKFDQPDHHWQHQLRYERDICAQLDALDYLTRFPTAQTRSTLVSCIENNECFFRVRVQASYALAEIANKMVHNWNGPLPFISTFKTFFKSPSAINIVKSNNFSDIQLYYLQKNIPIAMGNLRTVHNLCPAEVVRFILDLIKYNENSKNRFSDCYYRAALIDGLSNTLSSSVASLNTFGGSKSSNLSADLHSVIEEIVLRLNLEKILPSYHFLISASCLKALRKLQKLGHIPEDKNIFKQYALNKNTFDELRMIAFEILIDFLTLRHDDDLFCLLIDSIETDHSYCVKQHIIQQLVKHASAFKFNFDEVSKHSENYANKIWCLMNRFNLNYRMKSSLVELYHSFYGFNKPKCLRQIKETLKISETIEAVNLF